MLRGLESGIESESVRFNNPKLKKAFFIAGGLLAGVALMGGWREATGALMVAIGAKEGTE